MPKNYAARETTTERAAQIQALDDVRRAADDALAALQTGNAKQVREYLEIIQDVATKTVRDTRSWRKMVWLAEDALSAIDARNRNMVHEYLAAIRGVALCGQDVHGNSLPPAKRKT